MQVETAIALVQYAWFLLTMLWLPGRRRGDDSALHTVLPRKSLGTHYPSWEDRDSEGHLLFTGLQGGSGHQLAGEPGERHQGAHITINKSAHSHKHKSLNTFSLFRCFSLIQFHFNPAQSVLVMETDDLENINTAMAKVSYINSRQFPTPGLRTLHVSTTIQ